MILMASFLGVCVGWLICWLSDRLPALAVSQNVPLAPMPVKPPDAAERNSQLEPSKFAWLSTVVMLITAVLFAYLCHLLQFSGHFFFLAALCAFLILLAVIDIKSQLILNVLIVPAIGLMLLYQFNPITQTSWHALLGGAVVFLLFLIVGLLAPGGLGGGDIKLAAFLGVTFGLPYVFWALLAGALVGGGTAVFLLLVRQRKPKTQMPYGPFLCFGAIVALFVNPIPWLIALFA